MNVAVAELVVAGVALIPGALALLGLSRRLVRRIARLGRRTREGQRREAPPFPDPIG